MKYLSLLFIAALLLRVLWILFHGVSMNFGDSFDYVEAARHVCTFGEYPFKSSLPFFRAPGVSLLIALSTGCHIDSLSSFLFFQAFLDSLTVLFIYRIVVLVGGSLRQALTAAFLATINPFFIFQVGEVQTEASAMCFFVGAVWCMLEAWSSYSRIFFFSSGAFLALSALVRPVALYFLPVFALWCLLKTRLRAPAFLILFFGCVVTLFPWSLYVYRSTSQLNFVNDAGCYNLWRGNTESMQELYYASTQEEITRLDKVFQDTERQLVTENVSNSSSFWCRQASQEFRAAPVRAVKFLLYKSGIFFRPWLDTRYYSFSVSLVSGIWMSLLVVGFLRSWRKIERKDIRVLFSLIILGGLFLHLPFQMVTRFRIPYVDFILVVGSGIEFSRYLFGEGRGRGIVSEENGCNKKGAQDTTGNQLNGELV